EYALERLAASGEAADIEERRALWCLGLAERAEAVAWGAAQRAALDRLEAESGNLRSALVWAFDRGDPIFSGRLAQAVNSLWYVRGPFGEGRAYLMRALERLGHPVAPTPLRAELLASASALAHRQRDAGAATALAAESLAIWQALGETAGVAKAQFLLGVA